MYCIFELEEKCYVSKTITGIFFKSPKFIKNITTCILLCARLEDGHASQCGQLIVVVAAKPNLW